MPSWPGSSLGLGMGSGWAQRDGETPYVVVPGGKGVERLQVFVGRRAARLSASVGWSGRIAETTEVEDDRLPALVVAGFTGNGSAVPTMSPG